MMRTSEKKMIFYLLEKNIKLLQVDLVLVMLLYHKEGRSLIVPIWKETFIILHRNTLFEYGM